MWAVRSNSELDRKCGHRRKLLQRLSRSTWQGLWWPPSENEGLRWASASRSKSMPPCPCWLRRFQQQMLLCINPFRESSDTRPPQHKAKREQDCSASWHRLSAADKADKVPKNCLAKTTFSSHRLYNLVLVKLEMDLQNPSNMFE